MQHVIAIVDRLVRKEDGQDLMEYGLLAVLIAVFCVAAMSTVGQTVNAFLWGPIVNAL